MFLIAAYLWEHATADVPPDARDCGGLTLVLSGGHTLRVFPTGSRVSRRSSRQSRLDEPGLLLRSEFPPQHRADLTRLDRMKVNVLRTSGRLTGDPRWVVILNVIRACVEQVEDADLQANT